MKVTLSEFDNMKGEIEKDIILRLMDERGMNLDAAFDTLYSSRVFEKLCNPATGLYFQSSGYVYSFLPLSLCPKQIFDTPGAKGGGVSRRESQYGALKGKVGMTPDFDAPIEGFAEYM